MPYATAKDQIKLLYGESDDGPPILFTHELSKD